MTSSRALLDQAQSLARIDALCADPAQYAETLVHELETSATLEAMAGTGDLGSVAAAPAVADLEARDHAIATALAHIDGTISRVMRVRLDHALASDTSIAPPTRNVFASTVGKYANDLPLLAERVRDIAARGGSRDPDATASLVVEAARSSLALREALREPVLALVRRLAEALEPGVKKCAVDRRRDDKERATWSALRRELELVIANPAQIATAPLSKRLAAHESMLDELPPEAEVTFADMIELD